MWSANSCAVEVPPTRGSLSRALSMCAGFPRASAGWSAGPRRALGRRQASRGRCRVGVPNGDVSRLRAKWTVVQSISGLRSKLWVSPRKQNSAFKPLARKFPAYPAGPTDFRLARFQVTTISWGSSLKFLSLSLHTHILFLWKIPTDHNTRYRN